MGHVTDAFTWYLSRTTGLLGWVLLAVATLWGLLLTSRLLERRPSPAWMLDMHRHLGTLTVVLTVVHVGAILVDDFVEYTIVEVLVPFASDVRRLPVALGVIAFYLLLVVQGSSVIRGMIPANWWRGLHYLSALLFVLAGVHGWMIGTDIDNPMVVIVAIVLLAEILLVLALRVRFGRRPIPARLSPGNQHESADRQPDAHQLEPRNPLPEDEPSKHHRAHRVQRTEDRGNRDGAPPQGDHQDRVGDHLTHPGSNREST